MRRRQHESGVLAPLPAVLVGVRHVEEWVSAAEPLPYLHVDRARQRALGDTDEQHQARLLAERRLEAARSAWLIEHRLAPTGPPPNGSVAARRPALRTGSPTAAEVEVLEVRSWAPVGARCDFRDRNAW